MLNIQFVQFKDIVLNKFTPGLHLIPHEDGEDIVRLAGIGYVNF
jgi:hypothetical protein